MRILVLFFEGTFGSSTELIDAPHAIHGRNALFRRRCLDTIPALLEELIVDPGMMMQIGMDEHFRARVSDRPAKLILDHWTVGAGAYSDSDVENLSRALTGWRLTAPPGREPRTHPTPVPYELARRTGLWRPSYQSKLIPDQDHSGHDGELRRTVRDPASCSSSSHCAAIQSTPAAAPRCRSDAAMDWCRRWRPHINRRTDRSARCSAASFDRKSSGRPLRDGR